MAFCVPVLQFPTKGTLQPSASALWPHAPTVPLFVDPIFIGQGIGDDIAVASLERMLSINDKHFVNTRCEAKIGLRWVQTSGLRRSEVVFVAQHRNAHRLAFDISPQSHPFCVLMISCVAVRAKVIQESTRFTSKIWPL